MPGRTLEHSWNAFAGWLALLAGDPGANAMAIRFEEVGVAMPLLNYTTKIPAQQTAAEIETILAGASVPAAPGVGGDGAVWRWSGRGG